MGAWGPALFSDDLACDVRDSYRELLEDGVSDEEGVDRIVAQFGDVRDDDEDGPVMWLALAFTMSKVGRLTSSVRDRAISIIDSGQDLRRWEDDPRLHARRVAALEKVREQLQGPQPPRRKLRPPSRHVTDLMVGDVLGYPATGGWICFRVARIDDHRLSVAPILVALDYDKRKQPSPRSLDRLRDRTVDRRQDPEDRRYVGWYCVSFRTTVERKIGYEEAGFVKIGRIAARPGDPSVDPGCYTSWEHLAATSERLSGS